MENFFKAEFQNPFFKFKNFESNFSISKFDKEESENFLEKNTIMTQKSVEKFSKNMSDLSSPPFLDSDSSPVNRYTHHLYAHQNS